MNSYRDKQIEIFYLKHSQQFTIFSAPSKRYVTRKIIEKLVSLVQVNFYSNDFCCNCNKFGK